MKNCSPLKLTRLQITEEFQDFKPQQHSKPKFWKEEKVLNEILFVDPWLDSCRELFDDVTTDELLDKQHNNISATTER